MRELYALPDSDAEPHRPAFDAFVGDPDATPFLALVDGQVAGYIGHRLRRRLSHATFEGWLSDLVVRERFRGRGIGRALLDAAIAEWRLRGGHQVMLEVAYDRTAARSLYEAAGFENQGKYFEMAPVVTREIGPSAGLEVRAIVDDDTDFDATTHSSPSWAGRRRATRCCRHCGGPTASMSAVRTPVRCSPSSTASRSASSASSFVSRSSPPRRRRIPDLIVTEGARGRDVGAALLDAAFAEAGRRGAYAAALESGHHRAVAHRLYSASGMVDVGSFYAQR